MARVASYKSDPWILRLDSLRCLVLTVWFALVFTGCTGVGGSADVSDVAPESTSGTVHLTDAEVRTIIAQAATQVAGLEHVSVVHASASAQSASLEQTGAVQVPPQQTPPAQPVSSGSALFEHEAEHVPGLLHVSDVQSFASSQSAPVEHAGVVQVPEQQYIVEPCPSSRNVALRNSPLGWKPSL